MAQKIILTPPIKKISSTVILPGSKSLTNRSLILASLAKGKSVLKDASLSDDSLVLINALKILGTKITTQPGQITVFGTGGKFLPVKTTLNLKAAGTSLRFLTALCAAIPNTQVILKGTKRLHQRPIKELVQVLNQLGANIAYLNQPGFAPLLIKGKILNKTNQISIKGSVSSQFITSLMLISSLLEKSLKIKVIGQPVSTSYINMTIDALNSFGIQVKNQNFKQYQIKSNQLLKKRNLKIEGDASGASYFFGLAAVNQGTIKVNNLNPDSVQGDTQFPNLLTKMGCQVTKNSTQSWVSLTGPQKLKPIVVNMELMPDTAQTLAVVSAFAKGQTKITGLSTLKHKETDRLLALNQELKKIGIVSKITPDSIIITGGQPQSTQINTYQDHRMAMAFAVASGKFPITIKNPQVVTKSFPDFWDQIQKLGIKLVYL